METLESGNLRVGMNPSAITGSYAELHRHLDGSLRQSTLVELAASLGVLIPADFGFKKGMGLMEALACFEVTLSVLQTPESVQRVAHEMCEDASLEQISALEIRFAPQLHKGAPINSIVDAVIDGVSGRAGVILCGLYGEPPDVLNELVSVASTRKQVVGIDLAGGPAPGHQWGMQDYIEPFQRARSLDIGRTVHAAEGRPPSEIRMAIETLHAQRIGHGTTLLDDPAVVELVLEKDVTIEACPTSNVHTGVISEVQEHPILAWLQQGISVSICTDNTLLSAVDMPTEYRRVLNCSGMTQEWLEACRLNGHNARFER